LIDSSASKLLLMVLVMIITPVLFLTDEVRQLVQTRKSVMHVNYKMHPRFVSLPGVISI